MIKLFVKSLRADLKTKGPNDGFIFKFDLKNIGTMGEFAPPPRHKCGNALLAALSITHFALPGKTNYVDGIGEVKPKYDLMK